MDPEEYHETPIPSVHKIGITIKPQITKNRSKGKKIVVEYNDRGQPIGKGWTIMQSYTGVLARQMVPIIYKDWRLVPKQLKEAIWSCMQDAFEVRKDSKDYILSVVGKKWKAFKHILNREYIQPHREDPTFLSKPPTKYDFIDKEHWDVFVFSHTSNDFDRESAKQKETRANNNYLLRLARKGYTSQKHDLKNAGVIPSNADRSYFWKKTQQGKDGGFNLVVRPDIDQINELQAQLVAGTYLDPTILVVYVCDPEMRRQMDELKKDVAEVIRLCNRTHSSPQFTSGSTPHLSSQSSASLGTKLDDIQLTEAPVDDIVETRGPLGSRCLLALGTIDHIIAIGVIVGYKSPNYVVHMTMAQEPQARLPIEQQGFVTVADAIGSHVEWPETLVVVGTDKGKKTQLLSIDSSVLRNSPMPTVLRFFRRIVDLQLPSGGSLYFEQSAAVFGKSMDCYIMKEDILQFMDFQEISGTVVAVYCSILVHILFARDDARWAYVHPARTSKASCTTQKLNERANLIVERLIAAHGAEFLVVPYNPRFHWVLCVVHIQSMQAYYMDPLNNAVEDDLKELITMTFKKFATHLGHGLKKSITWNITQCPHQPGSVECGYYVLRYMRDIALYDPPILPRGYDGSVRGFSQKELDEVRIEWVEYVERYVMP